MGGGDTREKIKKKLKSALISSARFQAWEEEVGGFVEVVRDEGTYIPLRMIIRNGFYCFQTLSRPRRATNNGGIKCNKTDLSVNHNKRSK